MSVYAIGDIQGCNAELLDLLDRAGFNENSDRLWITGDIVNRGPESLEALRLVKNLNAIIVLGNHDLHLLAIADGKAKQRDKDTLDTILEAPDREELLYWLRCQPLVHHDGELGYTMVHAGLPPQWNIPDAISFSAEVETVLRGEDASEFYSNMYGDKPDVWSDNLQGWERLRFITNCFTRIRYCQLDGKLNMKEKGPPGTQPTSLIPWYQVENRESKNNSIIFGHWATVHLGVNQDFKSANVFALDTGCVWGRELTALRLDDGKYYTVPSRQKNIY